MTKVAYNASYGDFTLEGRARAHYAALKGVDMGAVIDWEIPRHDPDLIQTIEAMVAGGYSVGSLEIAEIPDGEDYRIDEYDGMESVETRDSYDWITP